MKLVDLVPLALLPIALGIPIVNDTGAITGKPTPDATAQFFVTADALLCRTLPNTYDGVALRQYPYGTVITATCWSYGEVINGNPQGLLSLALLTRSHLPFALQVLGLDN